MWQRFRRAQGSVRRLFKRVLTSLQQTGAVLMPVDHAATFGRRAQVRSLPRFSLSFRSWKSAGALALLCSGVAWASLPRIGSMPNEDQRQWQALGIAPLSSGG